jgi:hypothetical protein
LFDGTRETLKWQQFTTVVPFSPMRPGARLQAQKARFTHHADGVPTIPVTHLRTAFVRAKDKVKLLAELRAIKGLSFTTLFLDLEHAANDALAAAGVTPQKHCCAPLACQRNAQPEGQ